MATLARIKKHCAALPGATHDIKWGADLCYSVGGKMFAVMCEKGDHANTLSFKVDDNRFLELTDVEGIIPAPYMAQHKWVLVEDLKVLPDKDLRALLARSHEIILAKAPKKFRDALAK